MKTNVTMIRKMGDFEVHQRTKDGMFNATDLLKQWNLVKDNPRRHIRDFFNSYKTKELILNMKKNSIIEPYVKSRSSRGVNAGTWMRADLFFAFMCWISTEIELLAIKNFIGDEGAHSLCRQIIDVQNKSVIDTTITYVFKLKKEKNIYKIGKTKNLNKRKKQLMSIYGGLEIIAIIPKDVELLLHNKYSSYKYDFDNHIEIFKFNHGEIERFKNDFILLCFNESFIGLMNDKFSLGKEYIANNLYKAIFDCDDSSILKIIPSDKYWTLELNDLQTKLSFAIDMGYVSSFYQLMEELRKIWKQKHCKF